MADYASNTMNGYSMQIFRGEVCFYPIEVCDEIPNNHEPANVYDELKATLPVQADKLMDLAAEGTPELILYEKLLPYTLSEKQRMDHGHPLKIGRTGFAFVSEYKKDKNGIWKMSSPESKSAENTKVEGAMDFVKHQCCRCKMEYYVHVNDRYAVWDPCCYHWGKLQNLSNKRAIYSCCQGERSSKGCTVGRQHERYGEKKGFLSDFVETQPSANFSYGNVNICTLDCDMCYTTHGLELTRVTVIKYNGELLYKRLVKPKNVIIDYNTRFSGLTAADLKEINTPLEEVQRDLLNIIGANTILVGHGIENDLIALKLLHGKVVDTAALFPHYAGLPYRRSLRDLVKSYLDKEIQESDMGHNSHEDAKATLQLVYWKLKMDYKKIREINSRYF